MSSDKSRPFISLITIFVGVISSACGAPASSATPQQDPTSTPSFVETKRATQEPTPSSQQEPHVERTYPILLEGHSDFVTSAEFSPNGTRVVTASDDGTAIVWDVLTGTPLAVLQGHSKPLTAVHFDDTGTRVVTASLDGTARVWDAASGEELVKLAGHEDFVNDARFDPSGRRVVTASEDGTARIWDAETGDLLAVLSGPGGPVKSALFHPDGSQVATAHDHSTVGLWDAATGSQLFVLPESILEGQYTNLSVRAIVFNPDGSRLVAAGEDGFVNVWETETGANLLSINTRHRGLTWIDPSPDGNRIASAAYLAGVVSVWDASDGSELVTIGYGDIVNDVAFGPDGARVATVGSGPDVHVWDATSGDLLAVLEGHAGAIHAVEFSSNGEELVTASADGTARIWNALIPVQKAEQDATAAPSMGLFPKGPWWVLAGADGLWAVNADGTGATRISEHDFGPYDLDITGWAAPRGGHLAYITAEDTYYNATLHVTSLSTGQEKVAISLTVDATEPSRDAAPGDPALDAASVAIHDDGFAWSPDGRRLAFSGMRQGPTSDLYLYDTSTGDITRLTDSPAQATRPLWSQDGSYILYTALEGANIDTGMHVQAFWAVAADGSKETQVHGGRARLVGQTSDDRFILYSVDTLCGKHDVRGVDLSAEQQSIWEGYFDRLAFDPESGAVLVAIWADTASSPDCNVDRGQGLFLTDVDGATPRRIVEDEIQEMAWSPEARLFFARTENDMLAVSLSGELIDLAVPQGAFGWPQVAADRHELAWRGAGLWLGSLANSIDQPPQQLYPHRTIQIQWTPSGSRLLFLTADGSLYVAQRPEFAPKLIDEIGVAASAIWVMP